MVNKSKGIGFGILLGALVFGFSFWGISFSLGPEDATLKLFLYIPAYFFLFIYIVLLLGAINLNYYIKNDGLEINWGIRKIHINWNEIEKVLKIEGRSNLYSLLGASWPGYMIGLYGVKGLGTARMYATNPWEGFLYVKSSKGFFGITPEKEEMTKLLQTIKEKTKQPVEVVNMDNMDPEIKGSSIKDDNFYQLLFRLNLIFLGAFGAYLAIFFPGSGAPNFTILLLVLAVALFFFNIGNAGRLFQFSKTGAYALQIISIGVTGLFIILALSEITLK